MATLFVFVLIVGGLGVLVWLARFDSTQTDTLQVTRTNNSDRSASHTARLGTSLSCSGSPSSESPESSPEDGSPPTRGRGFTDVKAGMAHARSPDELIAESAEAWVPPGTTVNVLGRSISDGMVYVGTSLTPPAPYMETDPALIDPTLEAQSEQVDRSGQHLRYWPLYGNIPPSSRVAYLNWLSDGRRDPGRGIGYVFLFFYGLERRILVDAQGLEEAREEVPVLLDELHALQKTYTNKSFQYYAKGLREYAAAAYEVTLSELGGAANINWIIGRKLSTGHPISGELAFRWLGETNLFSERTPWRRCREAIGQQFLRRYKQQYGDGISIRASGPSIEVQYSPATRGIRANYTETLDDAVPPGHISEFKEPVLDLANQVQGEIDDYSRWIGRRGDRKSPAAVGLLPRPLVSAFSGVEAESLIDEIEERLDDEECVVITAQWLTDRWPTKNEAYMTGKEAEALSGFLAGYDIGIEPDVRYTRNPSKREYVTLFRLPEEHRAPGESFRAARLLMHLASAVAAADDSITEGEEEHLEEHLEEGLDLHPAERVRLRAHLARRLADPPTLRGVRSRAEELDRGQRREVARFLITVAGADGYLDGDEVRLLEKIYDILGFDEDAVHGDLHDMSARAGGDRGPVTVLEEDDAASGRPIPEPDDEAEELTDQGVTLDRDRLASIQAETREVGQVLEDVFADEDEEAEEDGPAAHSFSTDGLSDEYAVFLEELVAQDKWARGAFDELAERHDLMPGFALEQINQVAFKVADEPLLEGEDPVEINSYALEALRE